MPYKKTKQNILRKIALLIFIISINTNFVYASSFSSNYSVNDEALNFANNSDSLESSSYSMDLSAVWWTDRIIESTTYRTIDSNSELIFGTVPPTPPTPPGGGTSGPVAGGRDYEEEGEKDDASLIALEEEQELDAEGDIPYLHLAPDVPVEEDGEVDEPVYVTQPVVYIEPGDDYDGCSLQFENKFLNTNPYANDSDKDEVEDCDEALVHGSNPLNYDEFHKNIGIAQVNGLVHTEKQPLFVGRSFFEHIDFDKNDDTIIQIEINQLDPLTTIGLFFLEIQKDYNFVEISPKELEDGLYETYLHYDGIKQLEQNKLVIDSTLDYEKLTLDIMYDNMGIRGHTGEKYGVVALWENEDFVDVSAVVANVDGDFMIYPPKSFEDGDYLVTLYALSERDDKVVQTNYEHINFNLEKGVAHLIDEKDIQETKHLVASLLNFQDDVTKLSSTNILKKSISGNVVSLLSFLVFDLVILLMFFTLCKKKA